MGLDIFLYNTTKLDLSGIPVVTTVPRIRDDIAASSFFLSWSSFF